MRPRRWIGAGAVISLALTLITIRALEAPLILYPNSASLPAGFYIRSLEPVRLGSIVAFRIPDVARHYYEHDGAKVPPNYLFIKPIAAGPGDLVCNKPLQGLEINNVHTAPAKRADSNRRLLPAWHSCRRLGSDEFFVFSNRVPNSFDSRYYGSLSRDQILGTYRQILHWNLPSNARLLTTIKDS